MTLTDATPSAQRLAAAALPRSIALWSALLDAQDATQLYRIFETMVSANDWEAAMPHAWRAYGVGIYALLDPIDARIEALPPSERAYAGEFLAAAQRTAATLSTAPVLGENAATRRAARDTLLAEQVRRVAQAATEPLPLSSPTSTFATRMPAPFLGREVIQLVLMPSHVRPGTASLIEASGHARPEGFALHLLPLDERGAPFRRASPSGHSPGITALNVLWSDLGLPDMGPYTDIHDRATGAIEPRLGSSFEMRFVAGGQRAVLLLCCQYDVVRIGLEDCGDRIRFDVSCASRGSRPLVTELHYDADGMRAPRESARHTPSM